MARADLADELTVSGVVVREIAARVVDLRVGVEIKLDELDAVLLHEIVNRSVQAAARVGAREVEIDAAVVPAEILGMRLKGLRVAHGHLRLDPQAELHAGRLHRLRDFRETPTEPAVRTLLPVPARRTPVGLRTEPARVDHEVLEPEFRCLLHLLHHEVEVELVETAEPGVVEGRHHAAGVVRVPPGVELVAIEVGLVREVVGDDLWQGDLLARLQAIVEITRIHAHLDGGERLLPAAGRNGGAHLPGGVGHQVEDASAPRLLVPDRQHWRGAEGGAHPAGARPHACVKRLPRAAAFVHPRVRLRVDLKRAALEAVRVEEARQGDLPIRQVAHDRAPVRDSRHARLLLRLHADPVLVGGETLVGLSHAALEQPHIAEDVPLLVGVDCLRRHRDAQHRRENCSKFCFHCHGLASLRYLPVVFFLL